VPAREVRDVSRKFARHRDGGSQFLHEHVQNDHIGAMTCADSLHTPSLIDQARARSSFRTVVPDTFINVAMVFQFPSDRRAGHTRLISSAGHARLVNYIEDPYIEDPLVWLTLGSGCVHAMFAIVAPRLLYTA